MQDKDTLKVLGSIHWHPAQLANGSGKDSWDKNTQVGHE